MYLSLRFPKIVMENIFSTIQFGGLILKSEILSRSLLLSFEMSVRVKEIITTVKE